MIWLFKKKDEAWGPWSKPYYSGGGNFTQVRFQISNGKMERRILFVNISTREMEEACKEIMPAVPETLPGRVT